MGLRESPNKLSVNRSSVNVSCRVNVTDDKYIEKHEINYIRDDRESSGCWTTANIEKKKRERGLPVFR